MIIQCDKCKTKFRLDDSKVKETGVKVRCAKCRNVFRVVRDTPETEQRADFGEMFDESVASDAESTLYQPEPDPAAETAYQEKDLEFDSEDAAQEEMPETDTEEPVQEESSDATVDFDSSAFDFPQDESEDSSLKEAAGEEPAAPLFGDVAAGAGQIDLKADTEEIDFGGFDFGEASGPADDADASPVSFDFGDAPETAPSPAEPAAPSAPVKKEYGGLDFSDDDMFGEVAPQATEEPDKAISFDLGMDGFADAMKNDDGFGSQKQKPSFGGAEQGVESPFSLDEIDFGDDLTAVAIQQVNPEELKPSQEILFAPLAEAQISTGSVSGEEFFGVAPEVSPQELPPLPIASRRKQGPLSGLMITMIVALIGVLAFIVIYVSIGNKDKPAQDEGKISVREVDATFVKNKSAGELLVITGEVVNEYDKPRAAIQVKGIVFGADGQEIASKNAFCGNPLTPQQLGSMPMDKIEAAMANQFGDSLANMDVAPGKAIQFVIVMPKPDKAARDYGVEPAGSTVATGKQQQ